MGGRVRQKKGAKSAAWLPEIPCFLDAVPVGAVVRLGHVNSPSFDSCAECLSGLDWYQLTYRIGRPGGSCNVRLLTAAPRDPNWVNSPDHCHLIPPDVQVLAIEWPWRAGDEEHAEVRDPVSGAANSGPLFGDACLSACHPKESK